MAFAYLCLTAQLLIACPLVPLSVTGLSQYVLAWASAAASRLASPFFSPTALPPLLQLQQQPGSEFELQPKQPPVHCMCYIIKTVKALWHK